MAAVRVATGLPRLAAPAYAFRTLNPVLFSGNGLAQPCYDRVHATPTQQQEQRRHKHSKTAIRRIFKRGPTAEARYNEKYGITPKQRPIPQRKYPQVFEPGFLHNGWSAPPGEGFVIPNYPFKLERTKNKPNDTPGFLPVYSDVRVHNTQHLTIIRKISGSHDVFLKELRAVLKLPMGGRDDPIRVRTGGTVEVKGRHVREVKEWLAGLGF